MKIALVIGCARSGTSILGELLAAHEDVQYFYELHEVWEKAGMGPNGSHRLTASDATPEVTETVRGWFEKRADDRLVVEKCPRNTLRVPYIHALFPEARIVNIVRDGRDVTCSLKPGIGGGSWNHLKPENWEELMKLDWVERCARTWKEVVETAEDDLDGVEHLTVKYEDLVDDSEKTASEILSYLGLAASAGVDEFVTRIQNRTQKSYVAGNASKKWNRDDHTKRVGRWRENLSEEQQECVERILNPTLRRLGYVSE